MLKSAVKSLLGSVGLSLHRKNAVDRLQREVNRLRAAAAGTPQAPATPLPPRSAFALKGDASYRRLLSEYERARELLDRYEEKSVCYSVAEDHDAAKKQKRVVDRIPEFGRSDFAELSGWLFASSLINHRVIHQRIDEGSLLWRAVKMSGGPILEVGRAAGGSTAILLGASGERSVVSIDRNPIVCDITDYIFARPDVRRRLTLRTQSSREPIPETEFGMIFIDGDHSYEGVCHDIAAFWNSLRSFDGKPPIAVFHDAAANPISYVETVKRACDELIAERGVAKMVESWGSLLVLEKVGDIDLDHWHTKEDRTFWKPYSDAAHPILSPTHVRGRLNEGTSIKYGAENYLGRGNLDDGSWVRTGLTLEGLHEHADNPVRFAQETETDGRHRIEKQVKLGAALFGATVFVRPVRRRTLRLSISDGLHAPLAKADFELTNESRILAPQAASGCRILDAAFLYSNGYFRCELAIASPTPVENITVAVDVLNEQGQDRYMGASGRGFFMNLASIRRLS